MIKTKFPNVNLKDRQMHIFQAELSFYTQLLKKKFINLMNAKVIHGFAYL